MAVTKIKKYTNDSPVNLVACPSGDMKRPSITYVYDEDLKCVRAKVTGEIDWFGFIQASKDSTDISTIVNRANNGNQAVLNVKTGVYEDVTELPTNIHDLSKFTDSLSKDFDSFNPEIKALFNNDFNAFQRSVFDNSLNKVLSKYAQAKINASNLKDNPKEKEDKN